MRASGISGAAPQLTSAERGFVVSDTKRTQHGIPELQVSNTKLPQHGMAFQSSWCSLSNAHHFLQVEKEGLF